MWLQDFPPWAIRTGWRLPRDLCGTRTVPVRWLGDRAANSLCILGRPQRGYSPPDQCVPRGANEPEAQRRSDAVHTAPDLNPTKGPGEEFQLASPLYPGSRRKVCLKECLSLTSFARSRNELIDAGLRPGGRFGPRRSRHTDLLAPPQKQRVLFVALAHYLLRAVPNTSRGRPRGPSLPTYCRPSARAAFEQLHHRRSPIVPSGTWPCAVAATSGRDRRSAIR